MCTITFDPKMDKRSHRENSDDSDRLGSSGNFKKY